MIEVIDNDNNKRMASIMCGILYNDILYVLYLIKRDKDNVNMFVSKIIENSEGVKVIDSDLTDIEKKELEDIVKRIINKDGIYNLAKDGIKIVKDINLNKGVNKFNIDNSYVSTISNKDINECKVYYELDNNEKNIVMVNNDIVMKRNLKDILIIIFGILVICFCICMTISILVK